MGNKLGSSIRNDSLGHAMQTQDVSNVQFGVLLGPVVGVHRHEMSRLGESSHYRPYGILLAGRERQTHVEIHTDIFPFPGMNIQRLRQSGRPQTIVLNPLICVALCHIASSLALHSSPPELQFQIMVHLRAAGVDGIFGSMSIIENLLSQPMVLWNH
jgi:hypothetical protein